jgi:hypothetical protein
MLKDRLYVKACQHRIHFSLLRLYMTTFPQHLVLRAVLSRGSFAGMPISVAIHALVNSARMNVAVVVHTFYPTWHGSKSLREAISQCHSYGIQSRKAQSMA